MTGIVITTLIVTMGQVSLPVILPGTEISRDAEQAERVLSGKVEDVLGRPAAGMEVGFNWAMIDGRLTADRMVTTDASGRFSGLQFTGRPDALMAIDRESGTGGMFVVRTADDEIVIELRPLATVRGKLVCTFFGEEPTENYVSILVPIPGALPSTIAHQETGEGSAFRILLPPGSYDYNLYTPGIEFRRENGSFSVGPGEDLDLGALDFGVTPIATYYGRKPPDLQATDTAGADLDISFDDYRGKWILAYYFAYT